MEEEKIISGTTSDEYKNVLGEKETTLLNQEDYILGAICRVGCELDETDSSSLCMLESTNPNILGANTDRELCVSCSLTTPSPSILGVVQDESVDGGCSSDGGVTTYYCYFATRANYYGYRASTASKVTQMHVLRGNTSSLPSYYRDDSVATLVEGEATSSISYNEATMDAYGGWSWDGTRWVTTYNGLLMSTESVSIPSNHTYASIETAVWQNAWISLNGNTAQRLDVSLELVVSTSGPQNGIIYSKNLGSCYTTYTNQQVSFGLNSIEPQEALPNDSIITTLYVSVLAHYTLYAYKDQHSQPSTTGLGQIYSPSVGFTIRYGYYA